MPITVPCVRCKTKFQVPSKFAGQTVRCRSCGCMMRLPSPEKIQAKKRAAKAANAAKAAGSGKPGKSAPHTPAPAGLTDDDFLPDDLLEPIEDTPAGPAPGGAPSDLSIEPAVLSCSHCEGLLYYDPNFANQTVACPHCGNHLIMPEL